MNTEPILIRPAEPTYDEGLRFAHYVGLASEGAFRYLLGRRVNEILAKAFVTPGHDMCYEHVLFAEADGQIVGMGSGYTSKQHSASRDDALKRAAGGSSLRMAIMFTLAAPIFRFMHTLAAGDFYVEFLAVDEGHRGKGIGSRLLSALEDRAQATGSTQFAIDVAGRNKIAQKVYERYGFETIDRWPRTRLVRPNILRMSKSVSTASQAHSGNT